MNRSLVLAVGVVVSALLLLPAAARAQASGAAPAGETQKVVVTGSGAIRHGDVAAARDDALADARRLAVEQVVGALVSSETLVKNFTLVEDRILSRARGYVKGTQILEEKRIDADATLELRVEVEVSRTLLEHDVQEIIAAKRNPRLLVVFDEQHAGAPTDDNAAEGAALEVFLAQGFTAVDPGMVEAIRENESMRAALRGDNRAAVEIGARQGAEVVVLGKARSQPAASNEGLGGMISCRATLDMRAINCSTGEILATANATAAGLDIAEATAATKAIRQAADKASRDLSRRILERWSRDIVAAARVRVLVSGVPDYATLTRIKQALEEEVRGLETVTIRDFAGQTADLEVEIKGDAQSLARELTDKNVGELGLKLVSVAADRVEVTFPAPAPAAGVPATGQ